jgi:FecR protein
MLSRPPERITLDFYRLSSPIALVVMLWLATPAHATQNNHALKSKSRKTTKQSATALSSPKVLELPARNNTTVRTGTRTHTELTFADHSVGRLWKDTILDLRDGRHLFLQEGAMFLDTPANAQLASVRGANVAVDVAGKTVLFEYNARVFKLLVLKGTARLYRPDHVGDSVLVTAGQLVFGSPNAALSDPVDFDIQHFLKTSRFITEFRPLPNQGLIASEIHKQDRAKSQKTLIETNLVMYGGGTAVSAIGKDAPSSKSTRGAGP